MQSIRGVYKDGKITLFDSNSNLPEICEVILTVLNESSHKTGKERHSEEYYKTIRKHERVRAHGKISIINQQDRDTYRLFDYSKGGLSFIAPKEFGKGLKISAAITDPATPELILMELEMEVRGVFPHEDDRGGYKIGCMFLNSIDEELWHGVLQFLR